MAVTELDDQASPTAADAEQVNVAPADGRNARRRRNVDHVLQVVMEMFSEDALFPTMDQVAERSGLSLRSLYRYFADPSELVHAAIDQHHVTTSEASRLPSIGEGELVDRIDDFVAMRVRLYEQFGSTFRATLANAHRHRIVADVLADRRLRMREQFEQQFAPELKGLKAEREALLNAGDALTQLDTVNLMASQGAGSKQIEQSLVRALRSIFEA